MTSLFSALTMAKEVGEELISEIRTSPDKTYFPFFGNGDNIFKSGIKLDNVLFTIPGTSFEIRWYGFLIGMGILLALIYGYSKMKNYGLDPDKVSDGIIGGLIGSIFGARLYYIVFSKNGTKMSDFFSIRDGGLAIYGGLIGAILVGGIIVKLRKQKLTALLDIVGPCFLIGQCIGRWGNFFNQEAFGTNTTLPWGMMSQKTMNYIANVSDDYFATTGDKLDAFLPVHPCFLYESLWCLIGFIILHYYSKHRKFDGEVFLMYIGWYGLGRFFIEGLRTDSLYIGNIRVSQLVAGICVVVAIVLIIVFRGMVKRSGDYKFYYQTEASKLQLAGYLAYEERSKEKKNLKKQIREAKASGEDFSALEKEYRVKFGKDAKVPEPVIAEEIEAEDKSKKSKCESIIEDDDTVEGKLEVTDEVAKTQDEEVIEDTEKAEEKVNVQNAQKSKQNSARKSYPAKPNSKKSKGKRK